MFDLQASQRKMLSRGTSLFLKETFEVGDFYLQCFNLALFSTVVCQAGCPLGEGLCFEIILGPPFNTKLAV